MANMSRGTKLTIGIECSSTKRPTAGGPTAVTASAAMPVGVTSASCRAATSSRRNSGLPPVAPWHAATKSSSTWASSLWRTSSAAAARAQRPWPENLGGGIVDQLLPQRVALGIRAATGGDEQHGQALQATQQVAQELERRRVGPVSVVDGHHQRPVVGEVGGQPVQAMERPEGSLREIPDHLGTLLPEQAPRQAGR